LFRRALVKGARGRRGGPVGRRASAGVIALAGVRAAIHNPLALACTTAR